MARTIEDVEKSMKRSNDKQLKIEHELCVKVCGTSSTFLFSDTPFYFIFGYGPKDFIMLL